MKKITLMLCACAMAFAGLLVSCNNGTEKYIYANEVSYTYDYNVSGTIKEVETTGAAAAPTATVTEYTLTKATGGFNWTENSQREGQDVYYYNNNNRIDGYHFWINGTADESVTVGTGTATKTYAVWASIPGRVQTLYKLGDDLYIKLVDGAYSKVTISDGEIGDDEFTLSYNYTIDNGSTTTTVDTTAYSATLKFKVPSAE